MSEEDTNPAEAQFSSKGKGKAVEAPPHHDMSMDEDEESSEEEDGAEEEVNHDLYFSMSVPKMLIDSFSRDTRNQVMPM